MKLLNWFKNNKVLTVIIITASFLRLYHLNFQSIWIDELLTMNESSPKLSFKEANNIILFQEGTPRFYFFSVRTFNLIFGHTVYNARLLSVIFGILSVLFIYKLGNKLFNKNVGLISAVFLTFNLFHIEYSQEARSYSMLVFFVILSFYFLISFINDKSYKNAIFLGIALGLATNAQPFGLINVASIYLILLYILILEKENKMDLFKRLFLSGIVFLIIFSPVIATVLRVSEFTTFWITKPNAAYLFQIFTQLLGGSLLFTLLFIIIYFIFIFYSISIIRKKENINKDKYLLGFIIINVWIWFELAVILLKSYFGISIALHRYFIAIVPAFVLIIAVTIDFIKNRLLKELLVISLATFLLVDIFIVKDFYSVVRKSQFDKVAEFIEERNTSKHRVVSSFGWLMGYYFNINNGMFMEEKDLNNYLDNMRTGLTNPASFWYVDGNSKVFNLTPENQEYVDKNFIVQNKLNVFDAWCLEFKSKHNDSAFIELRNFQPSLFDGSGAMIFVENMKSSYPVFILEKGNYTITIKGLSLPAEPLNNENAHFKFLINNKIINDFYLDNNPSNKGVNFTYEHQENSRVIIALEFDNDAFSNGIDRNAIIHSIKIEKSK